MVTVLYLEGLNGKTAQTRSDASVNELAFAGKVVIGVAINRLSAIPTKN